MDFPKDRKVRDPTSLSETARHQICKTNPNRNQTPPCRSAPELDILVTDAAMTIEAIKDAITGLPEDAQVALAAWLNLQTMDSWDKEMQADFSPSGRGYHFVEKVRSQVRSGAFRPISEGRTQGNE